MHENTKSMIYVGVALVIGLSVWWANRTEPAPSLDEKIGQPLFPEFDNPTNMARLEIVRFDEGNLKFSRLEVDLEGDAWYVSSHDGYAVDSADQLSKAASSLIGLKIIDVIESIKQGSHEKYGVVEPNPRDLSATGVGILVVVKDSEGNPLVDMIVSNESKEVRRAQNQRYVRRRGEDPIYLVKIDPEYLSTRFTDWIDEDLLKLHTNNIQQIVLKDYSIVEHLNKMYHRTIMTFGKKDAKWNILDIKELIKESSKFVNVQLKEGQELDTDKLDKLQSTMAQLKIVNVKRKPKELSQDLAAGKGIHRNEKVAKSLLELGFYPIQIDNMYEIFADQGEVVVGMNSGVEYSLLFGKTKGLGEARSDKKEGDSKKGTKKKVGLDRYIMVRVRFEEDLIPKPDLENESKLKEYQEALDKGKKRVEQLNKQFADWYYVISNDAYEKIHLDRDALIRTKKTKPSNLPPGL